MPLDQFLAAISIAGAALYLATQPPQPPVKVVVRRRVAPAKVLKRRDIYEFSLN